MTRLGIWIRKLGWRYRYKSEHMSVLFYFSLWRQQFSLFLRPQNFATSAFHFLSGHQYSCCTDGTAVQITDSRSCVMFPFREENSYLQVWFHHCTASVRLAEISNIRGLDSLAYRCFFQSQGLSYNILLFCPKTNCQILTGYRDIKELLSFCTEFLRAQTALSSLSWPSLFPHWIVDETLTCWSCFFWQSPSGCYTH